MKSRPYRRRRADAAILTACLWAFACAAGAERLARQHILIVGSSTAYPIVAAAAEHFGRQPDAVAPVVESTGSGGGIKLFCSGLGPETPDIAMASRSMKPSERTTCARNGVNDIREIKIGYDGIVIASTKDTPEFHLGKRDLYLALAREVPTRDGSKLIANPYNGWREVNPDLPDMPIRVLGPPPTSGTRDILVERLLEEVCMQVASLRALKRRDPTHFRQRCHALREDGRFINAGENDARLVRKLINDSGSLGIFGYNFLDRNRYRLRAASVDGIKPRFELIESGVYPLSRPLFLYIKPAHSRLIPGLEQFVDELVSAEASGADGYLLDQGLIPLPSHERPPPAQDAQIAHD